MKTRLFLCLAATLLFVSGCKGSKPAAEPPPSVEAGAPVEPVTAREVVEGYAELVYQSYVASHQAALKLKLAVEAFILKPTENSMALAQAAWKQAREPYSRTEAFRFYQGPIDAPATKGREEGPEGRLNSWPLNEANIDYVEGKPKSGYIFNGLIPITVYELKKRNAATDEADVTLGYHAVEFLLWGQDLNPAGPGRRPLADYTGDNPTVQRRREYLQTVTQMLVDDLQVLVDEWKPGAENYRAQFVKLDDKDALGKILTGVATLAGFELATERIAVALDSGSQEDEQSCFSDNTAADYYQNMTGISDVYSNTGLWKLVRQTQPALHEKLQANINQALSKIQEIPGPLDAILASPKGSLGRAKLEELVKLFQEQGKLFQEAGKSLGVEVVIAAE